MKYSRPLGAAALLAAGWFALTGAGPALADHDRADGPRYNVALFTDEQADEQIVVVTGEGRRTGVDGTGSNAKLLEGRAVDAALADIRRTSREDDVSVVSIDGEGDAGVEILADGDDGDSAYIRIGEGGIVFHAGDGEDDVHLSFGDGDKDDSHDRDHDSVRIHARGGDSDVDDRAVVMLKGLDVDATREFITDLDDVPDALKRRMLAAMDL
jgi:hypothetical protein